MLTERGLTPHQHGVLMSLAEFGPTGQQQLRRLLTALLSDEPGAPG